MRLQVFDFTHVLRRTNVCSLVSEEKKSERWERVDEGENVLRVYYSSGHDSGK